MFIIQNPGVVPPGGRVRYVDPDDGWSCAHPYFLRVKLLAHEHRTSANLPIPFDWDEWFVQQVCKATPGFCIDAGAAPSEPRLSLLSMAANFTRSMAIWAREGFPIVPYETFRERYLICSGDETHPRCPKFREWSAFGITKCQACGCFSVKLKLATERCPLKKW